jgi:hyperosmotically inducible protein
VGIIAVKSRQRYQYKLTGGYGHMGSGKRDEELRRRLQKALDSDIRTGNYKLKADVINGEAQIIGIMDTLAEKEQVNQIASSVDGIKRVENGVTVSTDGSITDGDVLFEVNEELSADPEVDLRHVGAKSVKGNVFLVGTVSGAEEEKAALRAASRARGVKSVVSQLKINDDNYDPDDLGQIFHHQVNNDREGPEEMVLDRPT